MENRNECLSDSTYFEIDLSFLSQDIENLQKHTNLFLIESRDAYQRFAPIGRLKKVSYQHSISSNRRVRGMDFEGRSNRGC
jgi:hypothetical protein